MKSRKGGARKYGELKTWMAPGIVSIALTTVNTCLNLGGLAKINGVKLKS